MEATSLEFLDFLTNPLKMKLRGRNQIRPEFNMSSMTDVVFLLIIFFMIASTLAKQLNTIDVNFHKPTAKPKIEVQLPSLSLMQISII